MVNVRNVSCMNVGRTFGAGQQLNKCRDRDVGHSKIYIQGDSKRWTQFRTSIFPELYMVCE